MIASVLHYSPQCGPRAKHHFQLPLFRFTFVSLSAQLAATFITPTLTPLFPCLLSSFLALSLSLASAWPGKVFIYSHSVALLYPCCASLCQVEKSHFRHLQRHLRGSHAPSRSVFYLRFSPPLSSCCLPNLLAAGFCHRTTPASQVKRG